MPFVSATSPLPARGFTLTLANNVTVVEADPAPFNNTKEVIVQNLDPDNRVFMQFVDLGNPAALPAAAAVLITNSIVIPQQASVTVAVGTEGDRMPVQTVATWNASGPGSQLGLVFKCEAGNNVQINIVYVQNIGGA